MGGRRVVLVVLLVGWLLLPATPAGADTGPWGWPLDGPPPVGRGFAPPETAYGAGHRGVDLLGQTGQPVRAAGAGTVSYAGLLAGRGVVVVVHGGLRTTYEPVAARVSVGDPVALGEELGTLAEGHLGCPVSACLHWGLRRGEAYLDPLGLVVRRPVRLLPLGGEVVPLAAPSQPLALRPPAAPALDASTPALRRPRVSAPGPEAVGTPPGGTGGSPLAPAGAVLVTGAAAAALVVRGRR